MASSLLGRFYAWLLSWFFRYDCIGDTAAVWLIYGLVLVVVSFSLFSLETISNSKELEVSIVGLQNAGKTSLVHALTGQPLQPHPVPTVGFTMRKVQVGGLIIKCWDLGGQPRFRPMWERYSRGVDVIMWVVDSADVDGLDIAKDDMVALLKKKSLRGIPCLVIGNKSDLDESLEVEELRARLVVLEERALQEDSDEDSDNGEREIVVMKASCLTREGIDGIIAWLGKKGR
jgi:ADP-ribosylation factor-like protein 8